MCIIILDMDKQLKAYRFRIYPNATQRQQLAVEFGNARFAWNTALFARQQARLLHGRVDLGERVNRKTGEVRKVDKDAKKLTIRHGEIKNLDMPAMTMVFQVKDDAMLDKVKAGDKIRFVALKSDSGYVATDIQVTR